MTKPGSKSKYFKMKINTETGEVVKIKDEHENSGTQLTPQELEQLYQSDFKYVGAIFHTHSSPGCVYYVVGGWAIKICG